MKKTIEEKAKRYDEAIERAKEMCTTLSDRAISEYIFPELKKSEDERIKEDLIQWVDEFPDTIWRGHYKKDVIAWLEKQREKLPVGFYYVNSEGKKFYSDTFKYGDITLHVEKQREQKSFARYKVGDIIYYNSFGRLVSFTIANIVEDGTDNPMYEDEDGNSVFQNDIVKQKPADKVEPKFKVGDWIVNNQTSNIYLVNEVKDDEYCLWPLDGIIKGYLRIIDVDTEYHFWTIKDAKPGDVLHATGWHSDCIFIFSGLDNWKFDEPDGEKALATSYCCIHVYSDMIEFGTQGPDCIEVNTVKPATKIQCDLLFRNIRENGYEWDANALELKKISLNKEDIKPFTIEHAKYYYCIKDYWSGGNKRASKGDVVQALRGMNMMALNSEEAANYFLPVNSIKQKSNEWDEEDEKMFRSLHNIIYVVRDCDCDSKEKKELSDWLKSLEDRIQSEQKSAWGKKDEQILNAAILHIKNETYNYYGGYSSEYIMRWLKSLKDRVHPQSKQEWSEEEEKNFKKAIKVLKVTNFHHTADMLQEMKYKLIPKQDWSEEDESHIKRIIEHLEGRKKDLKTQWVAELHNKEIDWLKSLKDRYSWKPTEEQLDILDMVLTNESMDDNIARILRELREQLKILKGE